jgi:Zinc finger, C3HC4 type (RING finger)
MLLFAIASLLSCVDCSAGTTSLASTTIPIATAGEAIVHALGIAIQGHDVFIEYRYGPQQGVAHANMLFAMVHHLYGKNVIIRQSIAAAIPLLSEGASLESLRRVDLSARQAAQSTAALLDHIWSKYLQRSIPGVDWSHLSGELSRIGEEFFRAARALLEVSHARLPRLYCPSCLDDAYDKFVTCGHPICKRCATRIASQRSRRDGCRMCELGRLESLSRTNAAPQQPNSL